MSRLCLAKRRRYRPAEEERQEPKRGRVCCYVCGRPVSRMNGIAIGQGKWRHKRDAVRFARILRDKDK